MKTQEPIQNMDIQPGPDVDIEDIPGVVSMTDATGMFVAMPEEQEGADALSQIVDTPIPIVPKMGDGVIAGKRVSKKNI